MAVPGIKELLEAGVHFGHQTKRWDPKMKKYILTAKNGIYVLDLSKTEKCLARALDAINRVRITNAPVLFVGTKKTIKECFKEEALRCKMFHVTERWLGGMLTNFSTVRKSVKKLEDIEKMEKDGLFKEMAKKEVLKLNKKREKLELVLGGIRNMRSLPGALFVVDTRQEHIAVNEARRLGIPVIGITDTNCNPDIVDFPIPGNDDSIRAVGLIARTISDAILASGPSEAPAKEGSSEEKSESSAQPAETAKEAANQENVEGSK